MSQERLDKRAGFALLSLRKFIATWTAARQWEVDAFSAAAAAAAAAKGKKRKAKKKKSAKEDKAAEGQGGKIVKPKSPMVGTSSRVCFQ